MSAVLSTNMTRRAGPQPNSTSDSRVNMSIPVAGLEQWRREALKKVISLGALPPNWDGDQSPPPSLAVKQAAIELILDVPGEDLPTPGVVPMAGGGFHLEWSVGDRDLEIYVDPTGEMRPLRVEHGMPIEDLEGEDENDLHSLFGWLSPQP